MVAANSAVSADAFVVICCTLVVIAATRSSSPLVVVTVVVTSRSSGRLSLVRPCTVPRVSSRSRPSLRIGTASSATSATKATAAIRPATSPTDIRRFPSSGGPEPGRRTPPGGPDAGSAPTLSRAPDVPATPTRRGGCEVPRAAGSTSAEDATQPLQARADVPLGAPVGGLVVLTAHEGVREVLLLGDTVRLVVGVPVTLAVAQRLRARVVRIPQMRGHGARQPGPDVRRRGVDAVVRRVRLRGRREVDHRLGQDDPGLGHADELHRLRGGDRRLQRGRVRHPDVLRRGDDDPSSHEPGVLPRLQHPGQIVQRGIDVGPAHRLDEGAGHVVVLVTVLVVPDDRDVEGALRFLHRHRRDVALLARPLRGQCRAGRSLQRGQGPPGVPGGDPHEVLQRVVGQPDRSVQPARVGHGPLDQPADVGVIERAQRQHQGPRQQRRHDGEGRVLGRGRHQHDPAVLDAGQQGVLLGLGEAVDLVQEQHGGAPVQRRLVAGLVHDRADVPHAGRDRGQLDEPAAGAAGHHVRQRRLAGAGRAPEHDGRRPGAAVSALHQPPQGRPGTQQMGLSDHLVQGPRTHPDRERGGGAPTAAAAVVVHGEQVGHELGLIPPAGTPHRPWHPLPVPDASADVSSRARPGRLERTGRFVARHAVAVVAAWAVVVVASLALALGAFGGGSLFDRLSSGEPAVPGETRVGRDLLEARQTSGEQVLLVLDGVDPADPGVRERVGRLAEAVTATDGVASVRTPYALPGGLQGPQGRALVAADGRGVALTVELDRDLSRAAATERADDLSRLAVEAAADLPGATGRGGSVLQLVDEITSQVQVDLRNGEGVALPVSLLVMVLIFGGFLAAGLPLLGALASIAGALASLFGFATLIDLDATVVNVVTILGLGLCIDYGLLIVSRFREELRATATSPDGASGGSAGAPARGRHRAVVPPSRAQVVDAVGRTVAVAGRTVLFSGLIVATSLSGLLVFEAAILRAIGAAGVSVVLVALLVALLLVPALLGLAGPRLMQPGALTRLPGLRRALARFGDVAPATGVFSRLATRVQRRPWWVAGGVVSLLVLAALPALGLQLRSSGIEL